MMKFDEYLKQDLPFAARLSAYLKPNDIKTIFEVGCCEGEDSIKMSRIYKNATIYAFEPLPHNINLTKKHLKEYKAERVELIDIALSNKAGSATFYVSSGRPDNAPEDEKDWDYGNKSSSLMEPNKESGVNEWLKFNKAIKVKTERLDSFCKRTRISDIDLIYMDVQGAELMVLEGAGKMLSRTKAVWLEVEAVELYKQQPLKQEVEKFMAASGFIRVMSTVDNISGDQLYIHKDLAAKVLGVTNKNSKPRISVLMDLAEIEDGYFDSIESILNQTFIDFELLLIGADRLIIQDIEQRYNDPRIRIIENVDQLNVLSVGLSSANADLIALMDNSGFAYPERLEYQANYLAKHPDVGLVATNFDLVNKHNRLKVPTQKELVDLWSMHPLCEGSVMFQRKLLADAVRPEGTNINGLIEHIATSHPIAVLPDTLYGLRSIPYNQKGFYQNNGLVFPSTITSNYLLWLNATKNYPKGYSGAAEPLIVPEQAHGYIELTNLVADLGQVISLQSQAWYNLPPASSVKLWLEKHIELTNLLWSKLKTQQSGQLPVSVVMGVYDGEKYLKEAIQSVLDQTYQDFEFIIIDDGSSDNSIKIIQSLHDKRIRLIPQVNHRLVYTLNKGIKLSRGKLIARMDADDKSLPTRFEKEVALLNSNPRLGLVGTFFGYIEEKTGKPTGTIITSLTRHVDLRRTFYIVNPFAHGSTMYRKSAIIQTGGYRDNYGPTEDYELWRRIAEKWEVSQVPEVLYMYRLNPNGLSGQQNEAQQKFAAYIAEEQWNKPFVRRSYRDIVKGAGYYRNLNVEFGDTLYNQYLNEQYLIARGLLIRDSLKVGGLQALATLRIDHHQWRRLARPIIGCVLRKLKLRRKKTDEDENTTHS